MGETEIVSLASLVVRSLENIHFSRVERRIISLLCDGKKHKIDDVVACLYDSQARRHNIAVHIYNIKSKIKHINHSILCVAEGKRIYYQYVLLLELLFDL